MNGEPSAHPFAPDERDLVSALVRICALSAESLHNIRDKMDSAGMNFADACLTLGLATPEQIAEAIAVAHQSSSVGTSLIQTAIRRASSQSRGLVTTEAQGVATPSKQLAIAYDPYSERGEKVRALRTELLLRNHSKSLGTALVVASSDSGEGKSLLAAELALAFAQAGKRILLVDCNMRHPQQHVLFDCDNSQGLSNAISAVGSKPYYYAVNALPHLYLLTSGPKPSNPLELLSQPNFSAMVSGWKRGFEFVFIDTPPISIYSDALAIADAAGDVLLVSRAKHSKLGESKEMIRRLSATQSTIIGAVLNHF